MFNYVAGLTPRFRGIRIRLIGMILVAVVPLIAACAVGLYEQRKGAIEAAGLRAQELARRGADMYREITFEARALLQVIAKVPDVVNGSPAACAAFLEDVGQGQVWTSGFWVWDRTGRAVCTTVPGGLGIDISDRPHFREATKTRGFFVSDFFISRVRSVPITVAAYPVLDGKGEVTHVLGITLRLGWFYRFVGELSRSVDASIWLFDAEGTLMARNPQRPDLIGKNFRQTPFGQGMLTRAQGWFDVGEASEAEGIYGFAQVPGTTARIAVALDRGAVLKHINAQIARDVIAVGVALLIAVLTGLAIAGTIARPLMMLTAGAEKARCSEHAELPEVTGCAEVASLARSLRDLLGEGRKREKALSAARADAEQASEAARAAHARLREAIEAVPAGITILDADDRFVLWNNRYNEMYLDAGAIVKQGMTFEERLRNGVALGMFPDAIAREEQWVAGRMAMHRRDQSSHEQRLMNDRWLHVEERRTSDGGSIAVRIDITEAKRRERSFRLLFESNPVPMWVFDRENTRFLAVNDAAIAHYGYSREQFLSMTLLDLRDPQFHDQVRAAAASESCANGEKVWPHRKADGSEILVNVFSRPIEYENRPAKIAALIDVTAQQRSEARIRHLAHHDSLTDLANRTLFRERLEEALARRQPDGQGIALLCIDLDYFKDVNDTLGHPTGDELLRFVARRLLHGVREKDTVARIGGDEFAVIQYGVTGADDANTLALRLIDSLSAPYSIDGHEVIVTPSVGVATNLSDCESVDELLNHADLALYRAKALGRRSHCFFAPEMDVEIKTRRALEIDLRAAFNNEGFELHFQPLMDLASGEPSGFEALLRWRHPERGMVSPAEFIPLAEEIGLVVPLGEWVLRKGCAEAVNWPAHLTIAINLSPMQFKSGKLVETVRSALESSGLSPHRLELEITETVLLEDNDVNHAILHQLQNLGVRIAMDDFGTGYSSLSYLRRFPFNKVKIDRSFVRELPESLDCMTITRGIVDLAAGLGMETTAEGVETPEQLYVLRTYGCTQGQGYLFSPAVPAHEIAGLLASAANAQSAAA